MSLIKLTAIEALELMKRGEISADELTRAYLEQMDRREGDLHAYLEISRERALDDAARPGADGGPPLAGLPTGIKDVFCTRGIVTTCASKMLEHYDPVYTATCVQQLIDAGIVILGKTNMDEFAMGSSTENSAFGPTRNPWDLQRVPGGSSGGSAAAVAGGEAIWALGSDTGGSIRQPAALCGVVGFKPTYGSVSRYGMIAFASSFDQAGPITRTVNDAALMMQYLTGKDPLDSTSVEHPHGFSIPVDQDLAGAKIGVITKLVREGTDPDVESAFETAVEAMSAAGAQIGEATLQHLDYALPAYYILAPAEASSNLARFDGVRYGFRAAGAEGITQMYEETRSQGFGDEVKRRIMLGTFALSSGYYEAYYGQAQKVRSLIFQDFERAFAEFDFLISPTTPTPAFELGEKADDPLSMYLSDICTIPVSLAGVPAISIPCGVTLQGLPVGLQIIGPAFSGKRVLQAARSAEIAIGFDKVSPLIEEDV
ncbi:MAG: Asp-tRNA(Asn)/Glu-tRNA(Gln) amidotransferase subunit GatA [Thermoleophilia bacterium]|nr:Asp-tRNA(Asn)/Glu-tRNA(Gln) amidotransferase subunit GatA [Thermoleophilia bacterium]